MIDALATVFLIIGCAFFGAGALGLWRFPDLNSRLHALAKADNLGLGFVLAGLAIYAGSAPIAAKLGLTWVLALIAAATSSHLLAVHDHGRRGVGAGAGGPGAGGPGAGGPGAGGPGAGEFGAGESGD